MRQPKPAWWQRYALVPVMIGAVVMESWAPLPGLSPQIVGAGIAVLVFVAVLVWVHFNGGLWEHYEVPRDESLHDFQVTIYEPGWDLWDDGRGLDDSMPPVMPHPPIRVHTEQKWSLN